VATVTAEPGNITATKRRVRRSIAKFKQPLKKLSKKAALCHLFAGVKICGTGLMLIDTA